MIIKIGYTTTNDVKNVHATNYFGTLYGLHATNYFGETALFVRVGSEGVDSDY